MWSRRRRPTPTRGGTLLSFKFHSCDRHPGTNGAPVRTGWSRVRPAREAGTRGRRRIQLTHDLSVVEGVVSVLPSLAHEGGLEVGAEPSCRDTKSRDNIITNRLSIRCLWKASSEILRPPTPFLPRRKGREDGRRVAAEGDHKTRVSGDRREPRRERKGASWWGRHA